MDRFWSSLYQFWKYTYWQRLIYRFQPQEIIKNLIYLSKLLYLRFQNSGLLTSKALIIAVAKTSASSLLEKLSPYTCLLSLHWWKVGVAWLYFKPFNIAQFMTTWKKNNVWLVGRDLCLYLMVLQLSSHHSEGVVYKMMINMNLKLKGQVLSYAC